MAENYDAASRDAAFALRADKSDLYELVRLERFYRDQGKFDALRDLFIADSQVRVTWFCGSAADFAEASRKQYDAGYRGLHRIFPIYAKINGDRAIVESHGEIMGRNTLLGVELDLLSYCRFYSRAVRTEDGWRLATLDCIYVRDTISPTESGELPKIDTAVFKRQRASYSFLGCMMDAIGYEIDQELAGDDRPDLTQKLYDAAESWLQGA